jgi:uncharacterized repeat protein (TIGR01451 family)
MAKREEFIRRGCIGVLVCLLVARLAGADAERPARAAPIPDVAPALGAAPTIGHTYLVNSTLDEQDALPSNGVCSSTPSGKCTLRAAIMVSNYATGPNTIVLPAGTYVITRPGYDDATLLGDYDVGHDLTIQGAGSGATIVDGNGAATGDRAFEILSTAQNITMTGMTIRNGRSLSSTVGIIGGGGLYLEGAGHLRLSEVVLQGNTGENGGGIYANFSSQGGSMELDHVIVRANTAFAGGFGQGGGVYAHLPSSSSEVDVGDSQVYSNTADGTGGGFYVDGAASAHWSIERSQFYSNTAASGGAIGNFVPLAVADSRLYDDRASFDGGAIETYSPLAISRTTLDANTAGRFGGAIFDLQTSGSPLYPDFANIVQSTLSGNYAQYGGAIYHDGFIIPGSLLTLANSTVSGNGVFRPSGGTGSAEGGGIYVYGGQTQLLNVTIAGNRAQTGFGIHRYPGIGGGVYITASATLTAENSIIANNAESNGIMLDVPDDCFSSGTVGTLAYDLILTTTNCYVTGPQGGNIVGKDPLLGPLQNNGGSTQTRALQTGSPAIDAGAPAGCTGDGGAPITVDQRAAPRTDARCDIGAYEVVPEADVGVSQRDSSDPLLPGAPLTYTVVVTNNGPETATGIVLTDTLPASATLHTVASTQGSCVGTVTVVCNLGSLASGSRITVTLALTPTAAGVITNTAAVTAGEFDPVLANNTASETTAIMPQADLSVRKRDSSDPVLVGTPLTYTITVTNNGPSPATGILLTDTLPASATLHTVASSQGSCVRTVTVVCNLGSLPSGAHITVTVAVTPTAGGVITNTVSVTANEFDPVLANNTASETTAIVPHKLYLPFVVRGP